MSSEFVNVEGVSKYNELWIYQYRGWFQSAMRFGFINIGGGFKVQ
jgi:hypothetical protein